MTCYGTGPTNADFGDLDIPSHQFVTEAALLAFLLDIFGQWHLGVREHSAPNCPHQWINGSDLEAILSALLMIVGTSVHELK